MAFALAARFLAPFPSVCFKVTQVPHFIFEVEVKFAL